MKKLSVLSLLFIGIIIFFQFGCESESSNLIAVKSNDQPLKNYEKLWAESQQFLTKGLIKSSLKVVEKIYLQSKEENNIGEMLKSLFYKFNYMQKVEEETLVKIQKDLSLLIKESKAPVKQLIHSITAEMYWNFYRRNRYRFLNRSKTKKFKLNDMRTWDLNKIVSEVVRHYKNSLKETDVLKKTGTKFIDKILYKGNQFSKLRPTLYDFLAHRAIDFFTNNEAGITKPVDSFSIDSSEFFSENNKFIKMKISKIDPLSFNYYGIKYLQDLMIFHSRDNNPAAYMDVDFKRLKTVYQKGSFENRKALYLESLEKIKEKYKDKEIVAEAAYEIAGIYNANGDLYKPGISEQYKWSKKKALDLCRVIISEHPGTYGASNSKNLINSIKAEKLNLSFEQVVIPQKPFLGLLKYRNINKVYFRIIKTNRMVEKELNRKSGKNIIKHFLKKDFIRTWSIDTPPDADYQSHSTEFKVEGLKSGLYFFIISKNKNFEADKGIIAYTFLRSSNIAYTFRKRLGKGLEFFIINRDTSQALSGTRAQVWNNVYNSILRKYELKKGNIYRSNKNGYLNIPFHKIKQNYFFLEFKYLNDLYITKRNFNNYRPYKWHRVINRTFFFTDRAIYRPGQTVYFKGIAIKVDNKNGEKTEILPEYHSNVTFYDVNNQKIDTLSLKTNRFGTFHGSFKIPMGRLNGNMHIQTGSYRHYFSVEEYKRPKFKVEFKKNIEMYRVGDKVIVTGIAKAFSGYKIDGAKVKYRMVRNNYYPYRWYYWNYTPPSNNVEIKQGFTKTDENGEFRVSFTAVPDPMLSKNKYTAFNYTVYADVTDLNGETRSSSKTLNIGYTGLKLNLSFPQNWDKAKDFLKFTINSTNLSGEFIKSKGDFSIYRLGNPNSAFRKRIWVKPDKFLLKKNKFNKLFPNDIYEDENNISKWKKSKKKYTAEFSTDKSKVYSFAGIKKWRSGKYLIELNSIDKYGNDIKEMKYFTLYSKLDIKPPYPIIDWYLLPNQSVEPGQMAEIIIGSSEKKVKVVFETEYRGDIISRKFINLDNRQKIIKIPILEKHRGNLNFNLFFIKHNRIYRHSSTIYVPWTNKKLDLSFETFRNKLLPGQKEEWRILIKGKDGEKYISEMAATLYDGSLDSFRKNNWHLNIFPSHYFRNGWSNSNDFSSINTNSIGNYRYPGVLSKRYKRLNFFGFYLRGYHYYRYKNGKKKAEMANASISVMKEKIVVTGKAPLLERDKMDMGIEGGVIGSVLDEAEESKQKGSGTKKTDLSKVKARTNLNETAFFYPQLKTNSKGEVLISFTIPEALTSWKMLGIAHTKDLKFGFIQNELITQKELMVVPNPPRFFREKDSIVFTTKITNLSEADLDGDVKLVLFDSSTMKPVDIKFKLNNSQRPFKILKGQSTLIKWSLKIPEDLDTVTWRIVAKAGKYSDGEENVIPILKNRMLVTESIPLPVKPEESKNFKFEKLINSKNSSTLKHHKVTLEFTSNPAWYAVQALPYMMEYPYECMEQTFSRFYANTIAGHIVNTLPEIKEVFETWKNSKDSDELLSKLEKNQELKSLLLEETPWVMDAQNETQRKKRIALLFDLNRMGDEMDRALRKLEDGQMASGAWPWFRGMRESRYITQHIISGFAHMNILKVLKGTQKTRVDRMAKKAIKWLDQKILEDYEYLIEHDLDLNLNHLGYLQIHYLYARSYYKDLKIGDNVKKAFEYYKKQSVKYWLDYNKYMQGMISLFLHRYGDKKTPVDILKSVKEHAVYSEELGMYWKETYSYNWYRAPVERHALLIEAFLEVLDDKKSVTDLKTWLLKSKQTQDWKTTKATAEACYALLLKGDNWLKENKLPNITIADIKVDPLKMDDVKVEAGTGYFKTSWSGEEIKPEMGYISVKNNNKVAAWGALYWQYFEDLDKITPAKTPLSLEKELFIERNEKSGPVLIPIKKTKPEIGDRVKVRIVLKVDRDMEYVHMKDMRASGFEPENVISRYKWQDGLGYYESTKDGSTNFFMDYLRKGTYVFEYPVRITHSGDFSNGITSIQCMYAPEFASHSKGVRVKIE